VSAIQVLEWAEAHPLVSIAFVLVVLIHDDGGFLLLFLVLLLVFS
jgi:hypothetical protein